MELAFPLEIFGEQEYLHFSPQFYRYYLKSHRTICFDYRTRPRIFFLIKSEVWILVGKSNILFVLRPGRLIKAAWIARSHCSIILVLNNILLFTNSYRGGWSSRVNDRHQWLQVTFKIPKKIVAIATQGRQDLNQWVTKYWLSFSMDLVHYVYYKQLGATKVCFLLKVEVYQSFDLEKGAYSLVFILAYLSFFSFRWPICTLSVEINLKSGFPLSHIFLRVYARKIYVRK